MGGVSMQNGVLHVEGEPRHLLCGDYPYFRDAADNWRARLADLAEAGVEVVTTYVPWRHHAPDDPLHGAAYDFTGRTQPNRDVAGFLDAVEEAGLLALVKPGPFVHAELPYGGLPDYVDPARNPAIETELDVEGQPIVWALPGMAPHERRALPAPFGTFYLAYVRSWLQALAREVVVPRLRPRGPVVGIQLLNEGIYSESANVEPRRLGFAVSTLRLYQEFLRERYGTLDAYNEAHDARASAWEEVEPPRRVRALRSARSLLPYLDWSMFQGGLYLRAAQAYRTYLVEAGCPGGTPFFFNFNPNGNTFRQRPASNDGWYTRVAASGREGFSFGSTSWLGVVAGDPLAFRQYVMAITSYRGPAMEQNWGFSAQYDAAYARATPSVFESMVAVALGATGMTAYTAVGTRAWRDDPNLAGGWVPERTSGRLDATRGDYPGDPPVLSDGRRTGKFWSLAQVAQLLRDEARDFVAGGPAARVAWGLYAPYAWAGQWLTRGDSQDPLWRPPLTVVPRGAYHGLDAFVEIMVSSGEAFRQVDVQRELDELARTHVLCMSAHDYMDADAQERLARFVEEGGKLLLTNVVPTLDERLRPRRGALAERVFPHVSEPRRVDWPVPLEGDDGPAGAVLDVAHVVEPPPDARTLLRLDGRPVAYRRRVGRGEAVYLGATPWRAAWSGDDAALARANHALVRRLLDGLVQDGLSPARPVGDHGGQVQVWQHADGETDDALVFVVARDFAGDVEAEFSRPGGGRARLRLRTPSQAVHAVRVTRGRLAACYLKGVNDLRGEAVVPRVALGEEAWEADDPCDLCVTRDAAGALRVTAAHLARSETTARLGRHGAVRARDLRHAPRGEAAREA